MWRFIVVFFLIDSYSHIFFFFHRNQGVSFIRIRISWFLRSFLLVVVSQVIFILLKSGVFFTFMLVFLLFSCIDFLANDFKFKMSQYVEPLQFVYLSLTYSISETSLIMRRNESCNKSKRLTHQNYLSWMLHFVLTRWGCYQT